MGLLVNAKEKALFDKVSNEVFKLAGVEECILWRFKVREKQHPADLLYMEPVQDAKHYESYRVLGIFEEPSQTQDATDEGLQGVTEIKIYFNRKNLEDARVPVGYDGDYVDVGDIIQIFRRGRFLYVEARNVERTGWVNDSQEFTQYVVECVRNDSFIPERKIQGNYAP